MYQFYDRNGTKLSLMQRIALLIENIFESIVSVKRSTFYTN